MKVLVVSDTHGSHHNLDEVLERERPIDLFLHLGDVEGGDDYIEAVLECPSHIIRGNNDFFSDLPADKEVLIRGHRIYMAHGHQWYVSRGEDRLKLEAMRRQADVVMYGHTHRPSIHKEDGLLIMNPGSLSYPRQSGRRPSYIVMELQEGREPEAEIRYL
jgi:hypothetical protein